VVTDPPVTALTPEAQGDALPSDAYYINATPDCIASNVLETCAFELGFCSDGTYLGLYSDQGAGGTYTLDDGHAVDARSGFEFDFATLRIVEPGITYASPPWTSATSWSTTTAEQDALVSCDQELF
jgi:hypothetical protein